MSDFKDYRRKKEEEMRQRGRAVEDGKEKFKVSNFNVTISNWEFIVSSYKRVRGGIIMHSYIVDLINDHQKFEAFHYCSIRASIL